MADKYFGRKNLKPVTFDTHIFVNQAGYYPKQKKLAVFNCSCVDFKIVSQNGESLYNSKADYFGYDENSGDEIYQADFSDFENIGTFRIVSSNGEKSKLFTISPKANEKVFKDVTKAFYYLRCGCGLDKKYAGKWSHKKCHTDIAVEWENRSKKLDLTGGWHDAGDYGRYVTAASCALAHMLFAYRMFPDAFDKINLNIPESNNGVPEILSECRYELEWLLKMQKEDGGVYHKATTAHHAPFVMPEDDNAQMYALPVSSMAVADFVAICAMASQIYKKFDTSFAAKLLNAAEKSYGWLEKNPQFIGFDNPEGCGTGGYGERDDNDNRFWAEVEMFCATGDKKYHRALKKSLEKDFPLFALGYASNGGLAALSYILCDNLDKDITLDKTFREEFSMKAHSLKATADKCGYLAAMKTEDYGWGSTMNLLKHAMIFIIADYISDEKQYHDYICAQLDCLLGVNATGYSFVTGNGELCCNYPHFRPAHADKIEECIPGFVSGGANRYPCDEDAKIFIPKGTPPMKCYCDDVACYSLNEITIYWNSPAVFTCAYITDYYEKK